MGGMSAPAFDTLKAAKQLGAAGFDDAQAEAVIATVAGSTGQDIEVLKADVGVLKTDVGVLKTDVGVLKADVGVLKADVQELKTDVGVLKADVQELKVDVGTLKVDVQTLRRDVQALELRVAGKFEALYKHLWFMGAGAVAANAGVVTVLITLLT